MIVYFDMDRVLCDFATQAEKYKALKKNQRVNWMKVFLIGAKFWSEMNFFPGADKYFPLIYDYCKQKQVKVNILSSVRLASGFRGKLKWCREKLNLDSKDIILVKDAEMKASFAKYGALLIDDNSDNIKSFIAAGGKGYKFSLWNKETYETILKEIDLLCNR